MSRRIVKAPEGAYRVRLVRTYRDGRTYVSHEGPYATHAAAKGRVTSRQREVERAARWSHGADPGTVTATIEVASDWKEVPA